jgi:hypothetical protein
MSKSEVQGVESQNYYHIIILNGTKLALFAELPQL